MAIALVQSKKIYYSGRTGSLAFDSNVTAGNLIVVSYHMYSGSDGLNVTTDNNSATYTRRYFITGGDGSLQLSLVYTYNAAGGATTINFDSGNTGAYTSITIAEFSGVMTTEPIDVSDTNTGTGTAVTAGPITPTVSGDMLFGGMTSMASGAVTIAPDGDYTELQEYENGANEMHMNTQYRVYDSTSADTTNWTLGSSLSWIGGVAAFKAAEDGGIIAPIHMLSLLGVGK